MGDRMCKQVLDQEIMLRKLELSDAEPMLEWMLTPDIYEKMQYNPAEQSLEKCRAFIENSWESKTDLHYAITDNAKEYFGTISLKNPDFKNRNAELGIALHPKAIGKGIGAKALSLLLDKAFNELDLHKVYLYVRKDNERAVKFYKKNGWEFEGEFKEHLCILGEFKDIYWFSVRK